MKTVKYLACIMPLFLWHTPAEAYTYMPSASARESSHASTEELANAIMEGAHIDRIRTLANKRDTEINGTYGGYTPLIVASMLKADVEVMRVLLDAGADINATIKNGETALIWAAHSGHVEGLKYLLRRGANVNAICSKDSSVYEALLTVDPNFSGKCNAFNISYCRFFPEAMRALVEAGADPNDMYCLDRLILILEDDNDFLKFLVDNGFNLNMQDETGETLLLQSLIANKTEIVEEVIKLGADVNVGSREGNITPLMLAVLKEDKKMVELLLKHGAKPDAVASTDDTQGITALHLAASKGNFHIVKLLLKHGATPDKADSDGFNAFDIATKQGHDKLAEFLKTKAKIHKQKLERKDADDEGEDSESSDLVLYGGIGAGALVLIVVVLLCRKKKPAPAPIQSRFASHAHGAAPPRKKVVRRRPVAHAAQPVPAAPAPAAPMPLYHLALADGTQLGCYTGAQIVAMLQNGQITYDALVWTAGMVNWAPLSEVSL